MSTTGHHRCWAEIDLAALERNLVSIRSKLPRGIRYVAVVKADAYGHGVHPTVSRLMQANADAFAVANVEEGARLQEIAKGWPILVLGAVLPEEEGALVQLGLTATVSSIEEVSRFSSAATRIGKDLDVHVKIDTGMGRLGVWHEEAKELFDAVSARDNLRLRGIYTHYSDATGSEEFTREQKDRFLKALESVERKDDRELLIHADNSAGTEAFDRASPFNAVRVGLLQFGVNQYSSTLLESVRTEPVFRFVTRIGLTKTLPPNTPISYGRTFTTEKATKVAILTAGYGDGIPTAASNRGKVLIQGAICPILGRVTMDQVIVDVSSLEKVEVGENAVLIGRDGNQEITVSEFSEWTDSIPWEVFCSVTKRVPRVYRTNRV
ncbi:MAG: alanine racemase [Verrucomicrobiota bacterium]